jgi:hypothetical protein
MLLEQQEDLSTKHLIEHFQNLIPLSVDHSCVICYPQPKVVTVEFQNFWNWIETYFLADTYTLYSVAALPIFITAFNNDPNTLKSQQVVDLAIKLLLSISYFVRPEPFTDLISFLLNFTSRTNYFQNPVTTDIIQQFNKDLEANHITKTLTFATFQNPNPPVLPNQPNTPVTMNQQDFENALGTIFGANGVNITNLTTQLTNLLNAQPQGQQQQPAAQAQPRELSIVKVDPYHGKDDEDPYEWIDNFNQAARANRWADDRKVEIASGYLKEAASDWYREDSNNITSWGANNNGAFVTRFQAQFSPETKQNQWYYELMTIRQTAEEKVSEYSRHFKKILQKVKGKMPIMFLPFYKCECISMG